MLGVIRRYVPGGKDAEDILHDGFIVAFTRLGSLRDRNRVDYWLASIMKNLSLQFLQSQDVAGLLHDIPEMEDTPEINEIIDLEVLESLVRKLPTGSEGFQAGGAREQVAQGDCPLVGDSSEYLFVTAIPCQADDAQARHRILASGGCAIAASCGADGNIRVEGIARGSPCGGGCVSPRVAFPGSSAPCG